MLSLTTSQLIIIVVILVLILVLLLLFILFGINAFTPGGIFNAIVNALMPMFAGIGMGRVGPKENKKSIEEKKGKVVEDVKKITGNKH